jgi:hypothetical protein
VTNRLAAFDLEIAADLPDDDRDWWSHGRLGISCAGLMREGMDTDPVVMFDPDASPHLFEPPTKRLTREGAAQLVEALEDAVHRGFTIVTWNGLGFDLRLLALETGLLAPCRELAWNSIDMMFQVVCVNGYMLSLDRALAGMGLQSKIHAVRMNDGREAPISGREAPRLWRAGEYRAVMEYCAGDVRQTLLLAQECERRGRLSWTSQRGKPAGMNLGKGWLTVRECLELPEPDTSWMHDPVTRKRFTSWLDLPAGDRA